MCHLLQINLSELEPQNRIQDCRQNIQKMGELMQTLENAASTNKAGIIVKPTKNDKAIIADVQTMSKKALEESATVSKTRTEELCEADLKIFYIQNFFYDIDFEKITDSFEKEIHNQKCLIKKSPDNDDEIIATCADENLTAAFDKKGKLEMLK